jgi:hypothetical protein
MKRRERLLLAAEDLTASKRGQVAFATGLALVVLLPVAALADSSGPPRRPVTSSAGISTLQTFSDGSSAGDGTVNGEDVTGSSATTPTVDGTDPGQEGTSTTARSGSGRPGTTVPGGITTTTKKGGSTPTTPVTDPTTSTSTSTSTSTTTTTTTATESTTG